MPCVEDVLKPGLRWLTIASGVLLSVGGVSNCVTLDPFTCAPSVPRCVAATCCSLLTGRHVRRMFTGLFNFIFGLMIIGAIFNVEKILKQVAFLKHYWGRGACKARLLIGVHVTVSGRLPAPSHCRAELSG